MKRLFLSILTLFFLGACNDDDPNPLSSAIQWNALGLNGHIVNKVQVAEDKIYAATDKGFYALNRNANDQNWEVLGFENKLCQTFLIIDENEMIVSLTNRQNAGELGLYKTTDGGQNWEEFTNGFGGESAEPVWDIAADPKNASTYYAVGDYVVARSTDSGLIWKPVFGEWQGFGSGIDVVSVNPHDPESIWAGGQNAIEQGFLLHSADEESNWEQWLNLVEAPSVAKEIVFHPTRPQEVYVGFEAGLVKTPDNGETWETLIHSENSRFFFGLGIRESNPDVIYTAGWLKRFEEPQPFIIFSSNDGGETWEEHTFADEDFGGVYDMALLREGGQDKLYLGLYKGGVYEVVFN